MQVLDSASLAGNGLVGSWPSRLVAALLGIMHPALLASLVVVLAFSIDWLAEDLQLVPGPTTWAIEGLIGILALRALWERLPDRPRTAATDIPAGVLLILGVGSALAQGESAWTIALGLRVSFRFVLLYYALLNLDLSDSTWKRIVGLCLGLILLQIPIGLFQFSILGKTDDQVFGSVRSSGALVVVSVVALAIMAARYVWRDRSIASGLAIPILFVLPVVGEGKGFFLLAPIPLFLLVAEGLRVNARRALAAAGIFFVSQSTAIALYGTVDGNANLLAHAARIGDVIAFALRPPPASAEVDVERVSRVEGMSKFERHPPPAWNPTANNPSEVTIAASAWPRIDAVRHAVASVSAETPTALWGFGLGSRTFTRQEVDEGGSAILYVAPIARRIYESGFLGVALYWALLTATAVAGWGARQSRDSFWRALGFAFPGIVILYAVAEAYTEIQMDAPALTFWLMAAAVAKHAARSRPREAV